jgi:uncharacterized protein YvpB
MQNTPASTLPAKVRLEVTYRSQRNNELNPDGACNVTSLAMCLDFLGADRKRPDLFRQFEDELYDYAESVGYSRHHGEDLALISQDYGVPDRFTKTASGIEEVQRHLAAGRPAIVHGYFTDFGHIIVLVGYDEDGFIVHDPYGEWFSWGYDRNGPENQAKGAFKHYSYELIQRTCIDSEGFWVHFMGEE